MNAEMARAAGRGAVGAMAMTGMRTFTKYLGLIHETPPEAISKKKARGVMKLVPKKRRGPAVMLLHWLIGAVGAAAFAAMPKRVRRMRWSGPVWGVLMWSSYQFGAAPLLGLGHARRFKPEEHAALVADHLLYGLVISDPRPEGE